MKTLLACVLLCGCGAGISGNPLGDPSDSFADLGHAPRPGDGGSDLHHDLAVPPDQKSSRDLGGADMKSVGGGDMKAIGGDMMAGCALGQKLCSGVCAVCCDGSECGSGVCRGGACQPPSCGDGVQNGSESATDCGGSCAPCGLGLRCNGAADCRSNFCGADQLCAAPYFAATTTAGGATFPVAVALADLDGDGTSDMVVGNDVTGNVTVRLGQGGTKFGSDHNFTVAPAIGALTLADLHGNGAHDLVVTASNRLWVLTDNRDGSFAVPGTSYPLWSSSQHALAAGDLDGDGKLDVVVSDAGTSASNNGGVWWLRGQGDGTLAPPQPLVTNSDVTAVALAKLDGGDTLDLIAAGRGNQLAVLLGNGDGSFTPAAGATVGTYAGAIVVRDFDGDGKLDLAVSAWGATSGAAMSDNGISILLGNGDGSFAAEQRLQTGQEWALAAGEFGGDGKPDLVASDGLTVSVLVNSGGGDFASPVGTSLDEWWHGSMASLATAFLDGDGLSDVAVANGSGEVVVRLGAGSGTLGPLRSYGSGDLEQLAVVDVDGDGKLDLVSNSYYSQNLTIFPGTNGGTFGPPRYQRVGHQLNDIAVGDLDGDHVPDLVFSSDILAWMKGAGDGSFGAPSSIPGGGGGLLLADLRGVGKLDLVASGGDFETPYTLVRLGDGSGGFGAPASLGGGSAYCLAADITGDHKLDLVTAYMSFVGNGDGTFGSGVGIQTTGMPIAVGDFDENGQVDRAAVFNYESEPAYLWVERGNGDGSFTNRTTYPVWGEPHAIVAADFDGDHHLDLAVANAGPEFQEDVVPGVVSIYLGDGRGSFGAPIHYDVGNHPSALVVVDLNGDGKLDLAVVNSASASVTILTNGY